MLYKKSKMRNGTLKVNTTETGELIQTKLERITKNNEPITDGAPLVYTERKDGVRPEFNVKTDRFDLAIDATDINTKGHIAKRQLGITEREQGESKKTDEPSQ